MSASRIVAVKVQGVRVPRVGPSNAGAGWFVARDGGDGRDSLTQPEGAVVVLCGEGVSVKEELVVQVETTARDCCD